MKKALFLASLAVMTASVWGMNGWKNSVTRSERFSNGNSMLKDRNNNKWVSYSQKSVNDSRRLRQYSGNKLEATTNDNMSKFRRAVGMCNVDVVENMLANYSDLVNHTDDDGWTALHTIAFKQCKGKVGAKYLKIAKLLLKNRANINKITSDKFKNTPLHMAVFKGNIRMVKLLLNQKDENGNPIIDINATDSAGLTVLHKAIAKGYLEIAKLLLENGADCSLEIQKEEYKTEVKNNCLHLALLSKEKESKVLEIVKELLKQRDENGNPIIDINAVGSSGGTALHIAIAKGYSDIVKELLKRGADCSLVTNSKEIDKKIGETIKNNCLHLALLSKAKESKILEIVKELLDQKDKGNSIIDINAANSNGWTALHIAIDRGYSDIVKELLKRGADCSLITNGKEIDKKTGKKTKILRSNCLHLAVLSKAKESKILEIVKELLDQKDKGNSIIDINATTNDGWTALHIAIAKGYSDIVKELLKRGANCSLEIQKEEYKTGEIKIIKNNCLHLAASSKAKESKILEIIKELLNQKDKGNPMIDINATNSDGWTALHKAIAKGYLEIAKLLLENGADFHYKNDNKTAYDYAKSFKHEKIAKLIESFQEENSDQTEPQCQPLNLAKSEYKVVDNQGFHWEDAPLEFDKNGFWIYGSEPEDSLLRQAYYDETIIDPVGKTAEQQTPENTFASETLNIDCVLNRYRRNSMPGGLWSLENIENR